MARIADLPPAHRLFLRLYPFRRLDPIPWTLLAKPLAECRVALVTSAAYYAPDQEPFDELVRGGDSSFRVIDVAESTHALERLRTSHRSTAFDPDGIRADYNLALPVDRFRELEARGGIGSLHHEALSFMGAVTAPGRLRRVSAPRAAERLRMGDVDVVFLCPV